MLYSVCFVGVLRQFLFCGSLSLCRGLGLQCVIVVFTDQTYLWLFK